jgi:hypothetical protein
MTITGSLYRRNLFHERVNYTQDCNQNLNDFLYKFGLTKAKEFPIGIGFQYHKAVAMNQIQCKHWKILH